MKKEESRMKHNRADIQRDTLTDHPAADQSCLQIRLAGANLAPWGLDYKASAVVHYYQQPGTTNFAFIEQLVGISSIPEGQADVGHKTLRKALMKAYGREDVRRKDTKEEIL
jgi:hypothetical protein